MSGLVGLVNEFFPYAQKQMGFNRPVSLFLASDEENSVNPLGKTGFYNPASAEITVFVDGRHPKDILRSISHELVHHTQNCRGEFDGDLETGDNYAQNNPHLREMEREAYELGNLCFRDWENTREEPSCSESKTVTLKQTTFKDIVKEALGEKPGLLLELDPYFGGAAPQFPGGPAEEPDPDSLDWLTDLYSNLSSKRYDWDAAGEPPSSAQDYMITTPLSDVRDDVLRAYKPEQITQQIEQGKIDPTLVTDPETGERLQPSPTPERDISGRLSDEEILRQSKAALEYERTGGKSGTPADYSSEPYLQIGSRAPKPGEDEASLLQRNLGIRDPSDRRTSDELVNYLARSGVSAAQFPEGIGLQDIAYDPEVERFANPLGQQSILTPGSGTSPRTYAPNQSSQAQKEKLAQLMIPFYTGQEVEPGALSSEWSKLSDSFQPALFAPRGTEEGEKQYRDWLDTSVTWPGKDQGVSARVFLLSRAPGGAGMIGLRPPGAATVGSPLGRGAGSMELDDLSKLMDAEQIYNTYREKNRREMEAGNPPDLSWVKDWNEKYGTLRGARQNIQENFKMNKTDKLLREMKKIFEQSMPAGGGWEEYEVQPGDTLEDIALKALGDRGRTAEIARLNSLTDPNIIDAGMKLMIPPMGPGDPTAGEPSLEQTGAFDVSGGFGEYEIQPGDTLEDMALNFLGSKDRWPELAKFNAIEDPDVIKPGTRLMIPPEPQVQDLDFPEQTIEEPRYVVQAGDTLEDVAERELGDRNAWRTIADLNPSVEPDRIEAGQFLKLPTQSPTTFQDVVDSAEEEERESQSIQEWWDKALFETLTKKYTKR